jgi:hypothetical protein
MHHEDARCVLKENLQVPEMHIKSLLDRRVRPHAQQSLNTRSREAPGATWILMNLSGVQGQY